MYTQADFEKQYKAANDEAFNRSLRMQQQNRAQARLLHLSHTRVERDRQREVKACSLQKEALLKEQEQRGKLSPSIDQWMKKRAPHVRNFQDRERERLMSRYGRSARADFRQRAFSDETVDAAYLSPKEQPTWSRSSSMKERGKSAVSRSSGGEASNQRGGIVASYRVPPGVSFSRSSTSLGASK